MNGEIEVLAQKRDKIAIVPLSTEFRDDLEAIYNAGLLLSVASWQRPCRFSLPDEIANLFCDEVLTSVKRGIDVLKPERQRRVLPKPRA